MIDARTAMLMGMLIFASTLVSVEVGISVALIEIVVGVIAGNFLGLQTTPWIDFLAGFGSIVLTFLAGAEVDTDLLREQFRASLWIGGLSFLLPFLAAWGVALWGLGWSPQASKIAGVALSTTSLAVVYAVLVETGLTQTPLGKLIMASTFITDFGTAAALSVLFVRPTPWILAFLAISTIIIVVMPRLQPWFFRRYGNRVIEPEIKGAFAALLVLMYLGRLADSHAVLPAFVLGLAVSRVFAAHRAEQQRFRVVAFAMLTPFFFIKAGMNVGLSAVSANLGVLGLLLAVKMAAKFAGVLPTARRYVGAHAMYTTLLMSTGLTFGTIASLYGLQAAILDPVQFSLLVTAVILSAVVPTIIAQRVFDPRRAGLRAQPVPAATPGAAFNGNRGGIMIRHTLIAHDGSEEARRAVEVGIDLALRYGARATLLTVIQHPAYAATVGEVQETDTEKRTFAERIQREAIEAARLRGLDMAAAIVSGHPAEAIVDYAQGHQVDLIVMGHRGMSNLRRFLVGSVADRVVDHAPCPVLVVRRQPQT